MKLESLFEPIRIANLPIKNRIAMAPMHGKGLVDHNGNYTERAIDYFVERAFGGVGLIITGATIATDIVEPLPSQPYVRPETISSFAELAESIHYYGSKIFIQLTAGFGRVRFLPKTGTVVQPVSASALPAYWRSEITTRALTEEEVGEIVEALGKAAKLLREADIDGIELHGHEGYLLDQFTTSIWNKRNDKYGGDLRNRLTLPIEILRRIKDKAGNDFPVVYQFGAKHYMKGPWAGALKHERDYVEAGRDIDEGIAMAKLLEGAGYDGLHIDAGSYDSWYWAHPPTYQSHGCMVDLAEKVKEAVHIPVIAVGRLDIPELAEEVLKAKKADIIALGRGLLADPHWPKKAFEGKMDEIRPCTGCQDGCLKRFIVEGKPFSCAVNPATLREKSYVLRRVEKPTKVLIVGGGVAGMEAAIVAATRGCQVILYEKTEKLGGHLIAASVPDFKQDYRRLLNWYINQLEKLGVGIKLRIMATPELIKKERPDRVILATGATPIIPGVPGIEKPIVATCIDLLLGEKKAGNRVCVVGGGLVGCETALWLADQGKKVTIIEALSEMATEVFHANRSMLLDMLKDRKVALMPDTTLEAVVNDGIKVISTGSGRNTISCDTVALALGLKPHEELYQILRQDIAELYLIGDCKESGNIMHAIWTGYHVSAR